MSIFTAIFLGLIQGLTEFLPVSSSGHLVLAQRAFGISENIVLLDIILHLGTLTAVCAVFWRDIWRLLRRPFCRETWLLAVATAPAVLLALVFRGFIEDAFGGAYLGWGFLVTAVLLLATERVEGGLGGRKGQAGGGAEAKNRPFGAKMRLNYRETTGMGQALVMGFSQAVALLPGISRSGSTICGGLLGGLGREEAARFSFLMSIPVILGGAAGELLDLPAAAMSIGALPLLVGFLFSALSGFIAVRFMLSVIKRCRFLPFVIYLAALGVFVLLNEYIFKLF